MNQENEISIFKFADKDKVRVIMIEDKPWFIASDICNILAYTNSRKAINDHCLAEYVTKRYIPHPQSPNKQIEATFISEGNLYRLIIKSKMPEAQKFERWVCDEVLPQIRKTGTYSLQSLPETVSAEIITLVKQMFAELSTQLLDNQQNALQNLEHRIARLEKRTATLPENLEAFVYIFHNPDTDGYKIGHAKDLNMRASTGRTFLPNLKVILAVPCPDIRYSIALENLLRAHFYYKRINLEWYNLEADDLIQIYELVRALGLA